MLSKKKKARAGLALFACWVGVSLISHTYAASNQGGTDSNKPNPENMSQLLPDLIVRDIRLTNNCSIRYIIENIGPGGVPNASYQNPSKAFLKMYDGNKFLGGISLHDADPQKHLKNPGGSEFGVAFPGNYTPSGNHAIKIIVDAIHIVKEAKENNNELTKALACAPPLQIKQLGIGSDAAGNCYVHMYLNRGGNTNLPLAASKASFSNRSYWDKMEWGSPIFISFASYAQGPKSSTCSSYPCTVHVSIESSFVKDPSGLSLDGDYDGIPGGHFVQNIQVQSPSAWGVFHHE